MKPEKVYWFRHKRIGWGWGAPMTWQGWAVYLIYFPAVIYCMPALHFGRHASYSDARNVPLLLILTVLFVLICWLKGEPKGQ